jgi:hypothetical protein
VNASELDEAKEVLDVELPPGDKSAEVMHPGEESFDLPSLLVASKLAPVLGFASIAKVRSDHLNAVLVHELLVELVGVVSLVADQPSREFVEKASGKNFLTKLALGRRSARDRYGERKTVASGDSDDLGALAPPRWADRKAPLSKAGQAMPGYTGLFMGSFCCNTKFYRVEDAGDDCHHWFLV